MEDPAAAAAGESSGCEPQHRSPPRRSSRTLLAAVPLLLAAGESPGCEPPRRSPLMGEARGPPRRRPPRRASPTARLQRDPKENEMRRRRKGNWSGSRSRDGRSHIRVGPTALLEGKN